MRKALMAHLRDIRENMGIQQAKFALRMETTQSAISDLETGRVDPQLSTVQKFAATLGARLTVTVEVKSRIHHNRFLAWSD